jgi:hypothetical protein
MAILKHCFPNGIPIIVKHKSTPKKMNAKQDQNPERINQITLAIVFIQSSKIRLYHI